MFRFSEREIHTTDFRGDFLGALRSAVLHGINSGVAEGDVMAEARELVRRRAAENASKERISA